jgi:hypothetical protein
MGLQRVTRRTTGGAAECADRFDGFVGLVKAFSGKRMILDVA